ncbi:MAG: SET domain-containing protein-lysine N-methyltransferase [Elusimicrobia bacterium]|nr:SET domain-containing protein-lysine N-methyltransferase [Elusimicrobiota bacterium]
MIAQILENNSLRTLDADGFARRFGAAYRPTLYLDEPAPASLAAAADASAAESARTWGPLATQAFRRFLRDGASVPGWIARAQDSVGFGLFAARALAPGDPVGEYAGLLTRAWRPLGQGRFNPYLLKYPFESPFAVDAEAQGNELRFVNHSARRANVARALLVHDGLPRVLFVVSRPISLGEQFLLDYGPSYVFAAAPKDLAP